MHLEKHSVDASVIEHLFVLDMCDKQPFYLKHLVHLIEMCQANLQWKVCHELTVHLWGTSVGYFLPSLFLIGCPKPSANQPWAGWRWSQSEAATRCPTRPRGGCGGPGSAGSSASHRAWGKNRPPGTAAAGLEALEVEKNRAEIINRRLLTFSRRSPFISLNWLYFDTGSFNRGQSYHGATLKDTVKWPFHWNVNITWPVFLGFLHQSNPTAKYWLILKKQSINSFSYFVSKAIHY